MSTASVAYWGQLGWLLVGVLIGMFLVALVTVYRYVVHTSPQDPAALEGGGEALSDVAGTTSGVVASPVEGRGAGK
jgi:hypothetical protein